MCRYQGGVGSQFLWEDLYAGQPDLISLGLTSQGVRGLREHRLDSLTAAKFVWASGSCKLRFTRRVVPA